MFLSTDSAKKLNDSRCNQKNGSPQQLDSSSTPDKEETAEAAELPIKKPVITKSKLWGIDETEEMLSLYKEYSKKVGPQKRFPTKAKMWVIISSKIAAKFPGNPVKTASQTEHRYKIYKAHKIPFNILP